MFIRKSLIPSNSNSSIINSNNNNNSSNSNSKQSKLTSLWKSTDKTKSTIDTTNKISTTATTIATDTSTSSSTSISIIKATTATITTTNVAATSTNNNTTTPTTLTTSLHDSSGIILDKISFDFEDIKKSFHGEGRTITAEFNNFYLVACYVPNSGKESCRWINSQINEWMDGQMDGHGWTDRQIGWLIDWSIY